MQTGKDDRRVRYTKMVIEEVFIHLLELKDISKIRLSKEDAKYVYSFTITGCVGIVQKWLREDIKKSPHSMAELVIKLTTGLINSRIKG